MFLKITNVLNQLQLIILTSFNESIDLSFICWDSYYYFSSRYISMLLYHIVLCLGKRNTYFELPIRLIARVLSFKSFLSSGTLRPWNYTLFLILLYRYDIALCNYKGKICILEDIISLRLSNPRLRLLPHVWINFVLIVI